MGLVEGNSTNTVNTVEDTEFSSNEKEKKGIEVTSFNNSDEVSSQFCNSCTFLYVLLIFSSCSLAVLRRLGMIMEERGCEYFNDPHKSRDNYYRGVIVPRLSFL